MATIQPRNVMPAELVDASRREDVIKFLLLAPHTAAWKVDVLRGWGCETGVKLTAAEFRLMESAGFKTTPVDVPRS